MKRRLLIFTLAMASLTAFVALPSAASAASAKPLNLITSPLPINLIVDPGKTVTTEIRVKQDSGEDAQLKINLMKFGAYGNAGKPQLLDRAPGDDYFDWVKFDKTTFNAPNGVWQTVKMTISVPKTAAFGYYYAVVFSRAGDDTRPTGQTANAINGGTAVLVLLDAHTAGAKRQLSVASFASEHGVYEFLPANFNVTLHNTGNVHVVPHGNVFILRGKKQIAVLDLNDEQGNILPGSNRIFPVQWMDGFPHFEPVNEDGKVKLDKRGKQVMHLVWNNGGGNKDIRPHLRMGHYTAHLFAVYDDGQRDVPLEAEIGFWVIPWKFFLSVIASILLIILIVRFGLKLYKKRIMAQMRK